ncbi:MAG TPA: hypothetical protein VFU32_04795 [Ktedonobacterales bacterium]|nr:hypothetical protein [Ktedonobacterales bacterium]
MAGMIEQLLDMERTLKGWIGTDNMAAFIEAARREAEHIPPYAAGASSEAFMAGTLFSIEHAARMLREVLNIPLTGVSRVEITAVHLTNLAQEDVPPEEGSP